MPDDLEIARTFLHFMVDYAGLLRRHMVESNQFRLNSHSFSLLYNLQKYREHPLTMTQFAGVMGITKQQLTKLVNDLETQNFVRRVHNESNRRQVYVEITALGLAHLEQMIGQIIHEIVVSLDGLSAEDRERLVTSAETLSELFRRDAAQEE